MASTAPAAERPGDAYRRYALGLLLVVYVFNFIDRQILSILLQPIKEEFLLSDTQLGLLSGIAFALFYSTLGIPIARYADRGVRRNVIALALAVWSAMTALSGLARGFGELLAARIGVGVGEAGCSPPAHSLLADYFPPERRATALSVYAMGIPLGIFCGYLIGGWMVELFSWRTAFLVVGLPGVLLSLVVRLTLREPERGRWDRPAAPGAAAAGAPPLPEVARLLWRRRTFRHVSLAAALHAFVGYGVGAFVPPFLARSHGLGHGEIGTWLAFLSLIAGGSGTFLAGWLSDRLAVRDRRWYVWLPAWSTLVSVPFAWFFYLWPHPTTALLVSALPIFLGSMYLGPSFALTQGLAPPTTRALAASVLLFVINMVGLGLGPQAVGIVSDLLRASLGAESLRWALVCVAAVNLWSAVHYLLAARTLREELDDQAEAG